MGSSKGDAVRKANVHIPSRTATHENILQQNKMRKGTKTDYEATGIHAASPTPFRCYAPYYRENFEKP